MLKGYDLRKESRSFLLTLKGISGVPVVDTAILGNDKAQGSVQGAKHSLEYYMTLFNRDIGTTGSFYGRTYRSTNALPIRETTGSWDSNTEEYVYFHTSYTEKTSFAVIECVLVRDLVGQKTYSSCGYGLCSIFDFAGVTSIELNRGSPRAIGLGGLDAAAKG